MTLDENPNPMVEHKREVAFQRRQNHQANDYSQDDLDFEANTATRRAKAPPSPGLRQDERAADEDDDRLSRERLADAEREVRL